MPVNPLRIGYTEGETQDANKAQLTLITPDGRTVKGFFDPTQNGKQFGFVPHWATCPFAGRHRKK